MGRLRFDRVLWKKAKLDFLATGKTFDPAACVQLLSVEVYRNDDLDAWWSNAAEKIPRYYGGPEEDVKAIGEELKRIGIDRLELMEDRKFKKMFPRKPAKKNVLDFRVKSVARAIGATAGELNRMLELSEGAEMPDQVRWDPKTRIPFVALTFIGHHGRLRTVDALWYDRGYIVMGHILVEPTAGDMYRFLGNLMTAKYIRSPIDQKGIPWTQLDPFQGGLQNVP